MIKTIITICILILCCGIATAGEIVKVSNETIFVYGAVEDTIYMQGVEAFSSNTSHIHNYNKTICINSTVIEGEIAIYHTEAYDLEYSFVADINDSSYITRIVSMKQEVVSSSFITGKVLRRTLTIDGIKIGTYDTTYSWFGGFKKDAFYFCLMDSNIHYGEEVYDNISICFTQLNYQDQKDLIPESYNAKKKVHHKYISVGSGYDEDAEGGLKLSGLTGWFYNGVGSIPWGLGDSLQGLLFMPLALIQYSFNFIFTFLFLIINNWWYAILLIEIFCIVPALTHKQYPDIVATYISMHAIIFNFMYHQVILPVIALILRLIEVIRNLFRI
jgi:hypothetical protein